MKIKNKLLLLIIITIFSILIFQHPSYAQSFDSELYSEAAILIDSNTGKILASKNANEKMYPASTTKILTAILALENLQLSDKLTASYSAVMSIPSGYSNAAIQVGESLSVADLLDLFLIHSANEAGFILAEGVSGNINNFADLMNKKVSELGCLNTHFTNPSGIHDENHYSKAYDMALIAKYCIKNSNFRDIVSKESCRIAATDKYEERYFVNTNDLIRQKSKYYYPYAIGIKTGYTKQARNCLISASSKDGLELIAVVLSAGTTSAGESERYLDSVNLFNYGFSNYKIEQICSSNTVQKEIIVQNATKDTKNLELLSKDNINALMPSDISTESISPSIELNENITAPIAKDTVLGKITYNIDGEVYSSDLIASHDVEKSNLLILIGQIILAILVLLILVKLLSFKGKNKNKKSKNSNSIYKFKL